MLQCWAPVPPFAVSVWLYPDFPSVQSCMGIAVWMLSAALITMVMGFVANAPTPSVTFTVKLKVPAAVGVPAITPLDVITVRPVG